MLSRRDLLRWLLASPVAATLDVERLLWVPKPLVVVPAFLTNAQLVARAWEDYVSAHPINPLQYALVPSLNVSRSDIDIETVQRTMRAVYHRCTARGEPLREGRENLTHAAR